MRSSAAKLGFPVDTAQPGQKTVRPIAMFLHTLDDRAISRLALRITSRLAALDVPVVIISATGELNTRSIPDGVVHVSLEVGRRGTTAGIPRLVEALRDYRPGVLFAHGSGPSRAAIVARTIARSPVKIVTVEHTHYPTFEQRGRWPRDIANATLYRLADRVAGVSPGVVDDLQRRIPGIRSKTAVLPSVGPDAADVRRAELRAPDHPWFSEERSFQVVCSVGNLVPRKGQDVLVRALPLVRRELGDVRLLLIGRPDNDKFVSRLHAIAAELGISDHVSIAGYRDDPLPLVSRADAFASASRTEGFGMAILEAMACGVPVVAADCPIGPRYVLDEGRSGMLVPMDDPPRIAAALVAVLSDGALRERLVSAGRARAEMFTADAVSRRYLAVAQACLNDRGRVVVVAGPDGVGKTTVCDRLAAVMSRSHEVMRLHSRPKVLPTRGQASVEDPHRDPPYAGLLSVVKLVYLFIDFWSGWWLRLRPVVKRGGWVLMERGWWDIAVDPRRYRLRVPPALVHALGRIQPKPDLLLVLEAPVDVLAARKTELSRDEVARQTQAWRLVSIPGVTITRLDASLPIGDVVADATRALERAGLTE